MPDNRNENHQLRKLSNAGLSVIGGALFAMGCALVLSNDNAVGVVLLALGAFLLGAFVMKTLLS